MNKELIKFTKFFLIFVQYYIYVLWSGDAVGGDGDGGDTAFLNLLQLIPTHDIAKFRSIVDKNPELLSLQYSSSSSSSNINNNNNNNEKSYTVLDIATMYGNIEIVQYLLQRQLGGNPLQSMYYICYNRSDVNLPLTTLLTSSSSPSLHASVTNAGFEDRDYAKVLILTYLQHHININDRSQHPQGQSLLMTCLLNAYLEVTEVLLKRGANVQYQDNNGFNIVDWLVKAPSTYWSRESLGYNVVLTRVIKFTELFMAHNVKWDSERLSKLSNADEFAVKHLERSAKLATQKKNTESNNAANGGDSKSDGNTNSKKEQQKKKSKKEKKRKSHKKKKINNNNDDDEEEDYDDDDDEELDKNHNKKTKPEEEVEERVRARREEFIDQMKDRDKKKYSDRFPHRDRYDRMYRDDFDLDLEEERERKIDEIINERTRRRGGPIDDERIREMQERRDRRRREMRDMRNQEMRDGDDIRESSRNRRARFEELMQQRMKKMEELRAQEEEWKKKHANGEMTNEEWESKREEARKKRMEIRDSLDELRRDDFHRHRYSKKDYRGAHSEERQKIRAEMEEQRRKRREEAYKRMNERNNVHDEL